jgi:hypothetical protein
MMLPKARAKTFAGDLSLGIGAAAFLRTAPLEFYAVNVKNWTKLDRTVTIEIGEICDYSLFCTDNGQGQDSFVIKRVHSRVWSMISLVYTSYMTPRALLMSFRSALYYYS